MAEVAWSLTCLEFSLQERQPFVDVADLADPASDLGALDRDGRPQLVRDLAAPAVGTHRRDLGRELFVPALLSVSLMTVPVWLVILGGLVARAKTTTAPDLLPRMAEAKGEA